MERFRGGDETELSRTTEGRRDHGTTGKPPSQPKVENAGRVERNFSQGRGTQVLYDCHP
jgi:hypothetical protein